MSQPSPTRTLAAFACELTPAAIPQDIKDKLGILLLDHLRVSSMGARLPWADWARAYIRQVAAPGKAHVLFTKERLNAQHAAYLNVAFGGSFDADDTHVGGMLHPGIIMWSVALALAEETGASGSEVLAAVTAGYEVMIRTALTMQPSHFGRGYQSSGTCGPLGAAAAASRLLFRGADRVEQTAKAIGLAAGFSGGIVQYYYSGGSAKRIQPGHAAQSGIEAALLAQAGFDGPTDILEGQAGFFRAYSDEADTSHVFGGLGERFHIADILVKGYAAAARVHSAVEAMFDLRRKHGFTGDDIESVHAGIPKVIQGRLTNKHPKDIQAAQMSLPFSVALASVIPLPEGKIPMLTVSHYLDHIHSPAVGAIEDRLTMEIDPEVEAASGKQSTAAKLVLRLKDGREVSTFVSAPKGSQSRPFTRDEHLSRFEQELSSRISGSACAEIIAAASDLEQLDASWLGRKLAGA